MSVRVAQRGKAQPMLRIVSAWHRPPGLCCPLTIPAIHEEKPHRPGGPCHTEQKQECR